MAAEPSVGATVPLTFVAEMVRLTEVERLNPCHEWPSPQTHRALSTAWDSVRGALERELTPERVRSLSRWARQQMDGYRKVASLSGAQPRPVARDAGQGKLVLEVTVETLPSHSPLVTRWLKVYLICREADAVVEQAIVTIRGELQE